MTDPDRELDAIADAARNLVPELAQRLQRYGLGEIEVSRDDLRLRVVAPAGGVASSQRPATASSAEAPAIAKDAERDTIPDPAPAHAATGPVGVTSPAVGFFVYADGLGPGLEVAKGDAIGHVEMLGVRHDVRAPRGGTVRNLVAESGEAVEYGQIVVELEPAEVPAR